MPTILPSPQFTPQIMAPVEVLTQLPLKRSAIIIETVSLACIRVSKRCIAREPHVSRALSGAQPPTATYHWHTLLLVLGVMLMVLLVFGVLALVTRDLCTGYVDEFDRGSTSSGDESKPLLRTAPSNTALHQNYQACHLNCAIDNQTQNEPLQLSNNPALQPLQLLSFILGEDEGPVMTSPVEGIDDPLELLTTVITRPSSILEQVSAATKTTDPTGFGTLDQDGIKSQMHGSTTQRGSGIPENQIQAQHLPPNKLPLDQANESRAQTAPCAKIRSPSLVKSLTGLVSMQQATIHILAVGMSWQGIGDGSRSILPGPLHDIEWLQNVFASQENFRFKSLIDSAATLEGVRQSLGDMHSAAGENDYLVVYFSGHGAENDSFELYDPKSPNDSVLLDEAILNKWIVEFRSETEKAPRPVYIIFDFCRPSLVEPRAELDRPDGVGVIWACSPTESALDLKLKGPDHCLPRSCFLLSLILTINDVSEDPNVPVVAHFTSRMKELVRVIRGSHCYRNKCQLPAPWRCCQCDVCPSEGPCTHHKHQGDLPFQVVSIGRVGGNPELAAVAKYIADRFPLHIKRAADQISKDNWVLYFNPSRALANKRPLNHNDHHPVMNSEIDNMARNMTVPVKLVRF
ncbi:unnamed protein product [Rhizoctonia solani]|uniref:Peptidase C14 caspase domain-containing protein n=1 Tax=Rhizoctonia solani TaxID=456999 RepID=A0A8H3BPU8_9AGAM|nr:unnamed protein product [Rhizoctonia solani]